MSPDVFELILIILLILGNGLFSMAEIALVSARKTRLQQRADEGDARAKTALEMANAPNRFLSTTQIGISLIAIFTGALGGATLSSHLAVYIQKIALLKPYASAIALIVVVLVTTYFSLVIGELIPKRLGLNNPERIAAMIAKPMHLLSRVASPIISILSFSTELGLRLIGAKPSNEPPVTEEEIKVLIDKGTQVGVFEEAEQDIVEGVFRLGERRVDSIMTPRTEVSWLDLDEPFDEILKKVLDSNFSTFPVAHDNLDNVIGMLDAKELLTLRFSQETVDIKSLLKPPLFVPESTPALKALELLRISRTHVALVIDEYGGSQGMVTLFDILEAIVGDVPGSFDVTEPQAIQREDGSWLFDGMLQIDEFKEILALDDLPGENRAGYQTLGGFIMAHLGNIPSTGQHFEWNNWRFEILDMDGRRVDKVLVAPVVQT